MSTTRSVIRTIGLVGLAGLAIAVAMADPPKTASAPSGITILSDVTLPASAIWARDVRWASDSSVYLSLVIDGTVEMSLDAASPPKELIPAVNKPGGFYYSSWLAASPHYLVAAGASKLLTWRRLDAPGRQEEVFESISAIDVHDNRLAIVGTRRDKQRRFAPDGAIAWVGSLDKQLSDLKPILYDVMGPGAPTMNRCIGELGSVRFLPDGTLVVVPGVQPGVSLYDESGKLLRTWETAPLGIDTDCGSLTEQQAIHLNANRLAQQTWFNQRQNVDTLLPLPQGPGLVVRRVEQGRTRWDLKVLRRDGTVQSQHLPIEGDGEFFFLKADFRAGKVVFLLYESIPRQLSMRRPVLPRLIVAQTQRG